MAYDIQDLIDFIRSLQRTEGYQDCFRRDVEDCEETECAWRALCLEEMGFRGQEPDA